MIGGNENNLAMIKQDHDAIKAVAAVAHDAGILIHVEGIPFGKFNTAATLNDEAQIEGD